MSFRTAPMKTVTGQYRLTHTWKSQDLGKEIRLSSSSRRQSERRQTGPARQGQGTKSETRRAATQRASWPCRACLRRPERRGSAPAAETPVPGAQGRRWVEEARGGQGGRGGGGEGASLVGGEAQGCRGAQAECGAQAAGQEDHVRLDPAFLLRTPVTSRTHTGTCSFREITCDCERQRKGAGRYKGELWVSVCESSIV